MCTLALKEVVHYYTSRKGQVFCCLLDATKAFDRVRHDKLFDILCKRDIPCCIIRLLCDMYNRQRIRTVWQGAVSSEFSASNGVRQGSVLSPILFALYIDVLLKRLEDSGIGCYVGSEFLGALGSADDITLLAPNLHCIQQLINICEDFAHEFDRLMKRKLFVCGLIVTSYLL